MHWQVQAARIKCIFLPVMRSRPEYCSLVAPSSALLSPPLCLDWHRKSSLSGVINEVVNWSTIVFDGAILLPCWWDENKEILTNQLVVVEIKDFQLGQTDDALRNFAYRKWSENSIIKEVVDWSTIVFDGTILLPHGWIKIKKYWPASWLLLRKSSSNLVNLASSEGIGPIESEVKTAS